MPEISDDHARWTWYIRYLIELLTFLEIAAFLVFIGLSRNRELSGSPLPWETIFSYHGIVAGLLIVVPIAFTCVVGCSPIVLAWKPECVRYRALRKHQSRLPRRLSDILEQKTDGAFDMRSPVERELNDLYLRTWRRLEDSRLQGRYRVLRKHRSRLPRRLRGILKRKADGAFDMRSPVEQELNDLYLRAWRRLEDSRLQGRLNMAAGLLIALMGPIVFFGWDYTLHSEIAHHIDVGEGWELYRITESIPRLVLFMFLELIAGFFLKQYSKIVELHREAEVYMRETEGLILSYLLRDRYDRNNSMLELANIVVKGPNVTAGTSGSIDPDTIFTGQNPVAKAELQGLIGRLMEILKGAK